MSNIPELSNNDVTIPMNVTLLSNIIKSGLMTDVNIPMNVTSDTCGPHQINISFSAEREYSEFDDSDVVKKIKASGILDDDEFSFKNGYIFPKSSSSFALDNTYNRNSYYKSAYIKKSDCITLNTLVDEETIDFILIDTNDDNVLEYQKFVNNDFKIDGLWLADPDDVVLKLSYCDVLFDYPCFDSKVVFTLHPTDKMIGFTRKELALSVMQKYHMLYYLSCNYSTAVGKVVDDKTSIKREDSVFRPIMEYEWRDNGVLQLQYNKIKDQWCVIYEDYI